MQLLASQLGTGAVGQIGGQLGLDEQKTQQIVGMALPMILGALDRNTSSASGAKALTGALKRDHDGSILNDLSQALMAPETLDDGTKILGHVLGDRRGQVVNSVSRATKTDSEQVLKAFALLAPVVLGAVGQMQRKKKLNAKGVSSLLREERRTVETTSSGLTQLLDFDGDGDVSEEIVSLGSNLLGGLFGSK
jgi:hypothetical protein